MLTDAQPRQVAPRGSADPERTPAHPQGVGIVEDKHLVVGSEPHVAFDSAAELESAGEGGQAVLWESGAIMEAPVGEAGRTRVERVRL